ncbi:MAG: hypothetical protein J6112_07675 [Clostridia bacterium]|nr:hypothetical protein [Clostridia bacterium]
MEKKDYKVISDVSIMRKKVFLTILCFLLALGFVMVIFYLVVGRKTDAWLDGTGGLSRASVFPFVFSSGDDLYAVDEDLNVSDIDNNTSNAILDNNLKKVYYIYSPSNELYEYDVKNKTRVMLCPGVESFKLFKERTNIPYNATDGSIKLYSLNSKSSSVIREPVETEYRTLPSSALDFVLGKNSIVFFDNFDLDKGTASLKQWLSGGDIVTLSEGVFYTKSPVILANDTAVAYYTDAGLCVSPRSGEALTVPGNASLVRTNDFAYAELLLVPPTGFDASENIKFYYTGTSDPNSSGSDIYEISVSLRSVTGNKIAEKVHSIINYSKKYSTLIYSIEEDGDYLIYSVRPGSRPDLITKAPFDTSVYYDVSSDLLYLINADNTINTIDIFDKHRSDFEASGGIGTVAPYFGKPFSVVYSKDFKTKTIILKQSGIETYPATEFRLYGKSDSIYLKARSITGKSTVSLDLVNGSEAKRITNSCNSSCIIYDKDISGIIYYDSGTLYYFKNGVRSVIGDFDADVLPVNVLTD